jgi:hypothetical protein
MANAGVGWDFGSWEVGVDVISLFDADDHDIAYYFESRLPGEPQAMDDVHFHPVDARSIRANVRWSL